MKQRYLIPDFKRPQLSRIVQINGIIDDYLAQGLRLTLRQLYYQLVSRNIIPNNEKSYKNTGNLVSRGRLAGLIDWDAIEDRGRVPSVPYNPHESIDADVALTAKGFTVDHWRDQPERVEVWIEKQALSGIFSDVCWNWQVPFSANKGYTSQSMLKEAADRIIDYGKPTHVLYFGDHDPSGLDMVRDVTDRLRVFRCYNVEVHHCALTDEQIEEHHPPPNYAKVTDSRFEKYRDEYGEECWEVDALEPVTLRETAEDFIARFIDTDKWHKRIEHEETERGKLKRFLERPFKHVPVYPAP